MKLLFRSVDSELFPLNNDVNFFDKVIWKFGDSSNPKILLLLNIRGITTRLYETDVSETIYWHDYTNTAITLNENLT